MHPGRPPPACTGRLRAQSPDLRGVLNRLDADRRA